MGGWVKCYSCRGSKKCTVCGGRGVLDHNRTCACGNGRCGTCGGRGEVYDDRKK